MPYLIFVTPQPVPDFDIPVKQAFPDIGIINREVLDDRAVRWNISEAISKKTLDVIRRTFRFDVFYYEHKPDIRLFLADMDSTIVQGETLDDMAEAAGIGAQVATITEKAMRGELDFESALRKRVALLKGQPATLIEEVMNEMAYNQGARELLNYLKSHNVYCVLISGGFTQFTAQVAKDLGFDAHFGNRLLADENTQTLNGEVGLPILDKSFKEEKLKELQSTMNLKPHQIMAVGDGANDLPMLEAAGFGIGYHPKPLLTKRLINHVKYTDLLSLRYLQKA
jgi:phosphoserine phosphatase